MHAWLQSVHRKFHRAITNVAMVHNRIDDISIGNANMDWPSNMMPRSASSNGVNGKIRMGICSISGKFSYEKKMPLKVHMGNMTKLISPDMVSIVLARLAISNPTPANCNPPNRTTNKKSNHGPWLETENAR